MKTDAKIIREQRRSMLLSVLNNRKCKRYRQGVLRFAVLCAMIDHDE